jgi:hypothetical protein
MTEAPDPPMDVPPTLNTTEITCSLPPEEAENLERDIASGECRKQGIIRARWLGADPEKPSNQLVTLTKLKSVKASGMWGR